MTKHYGSPAEALANAGPGESIQWDGVGFLTAKLTHPGLLTQDQIDAAVAKERARITEGVDKMIQDCKSIRTKALEDGDEGFARSMAHRLMELALVRGLVNENSK